MEISEKEEKTFILDFLNTQSQNPMASFYRYRLVRRYIADEREGGRGGGRQRKKRENSL